MPALRFSSVLFMAFAALLHCGGAVSSRTPGASADDSGAPEPRPPPPSPCPGSPSTPIGRPQAAPCSTNATGPSVPCTTLADCADAGVSPYYPAIACLAGECAIDRCLVDSDCPTGEDCVCADQQYGNAPRLNQCLASTCRTNGDCGSGELCSASTGGGCGSVTGYFCHTPADTCATSADCCADEDGGPSACFYQPTLGHWACQAAQLVCNG